ncbi:MAG: sodium:solute symporter [Kiritimatiellales bacterium]
MIWGLHILDIVVIVAYLVIVLWIGWAVSRGVNDEDDYFLAGRKLGRWVQFFLNFGQATDANGAVSTSAFVYRNGIGGLWFGLQTLFLTPYFWFMNTWFRRVRLMTMAELFEDRFGCKKLAGAYAAFGIMTATLAMASGFLLSARTLDVVLVKAPQNYTVEESRQVALYDEFSQLSSRLQSAKLSPAEMERYQTLRSLKDSGKIRPLVSYLNEDWFYIIYAAMIGIYVVMGGFGAAALTNTIQGVLIIIFSVILIPFGLHRVGGFHGLHDRVPAVMFRMFGDVTSGEFTWYSIASIVLVSWVLIPGIIGNMQCAGSAKDEMAARLGAVTGLFCKRFMLIAWGFCGLLAYAMYQNTIAIPDSAWGRMTNSLLGPGGIGLMLVGILAANMSSIDSATLQISALFVRNIYRPLLPERSQTHYLMAGRAVIVLTLVCGVLFAKYSTSALDILKFLLGATVTFGAPVLLMFFWRRLTRQAVIIQVVICMTVLFFLPLILPGFSRVRENPALLTMTQPIASERQIEADQADVDAGLASAVGDPIVQRFAIEPVSIFFDSIGLSKPDDPSSARVGQGTFRIELYLLSLTGMDLTRFSPAGLLTARYLFDSLLPFMLLFIISPLTRRTDESIVRHFYAKMATPVHADPAVDAQEVRLTMENPHRFDDRKLFPRSQWEFKKWNKTDTVGFLLCWAGVGGILLLLWLILRAGS